jgi:hypothetical protein
VFNSNILGDSVNCGAADEAELNIEPKYCMLGRSAYKYEENKLIVVLLFFNKKAIMELQTVLIFSMF